MAEPPISVITPTWRRHDLLLDRCIPSVRIQDYPNVEHVVVSDGPDPELATRMGAEAPDVVFAELPEHAGARWGHWARLRALELATGDYIAYLDDDNEFRPRHLSSVAAAMFAEDADFGYSQALFCQAGGSWVIGSVPPAYGQIDTSVIVHRRELLGKATWRDEGQETVDWDLVHRWLQDGATWAFHHEITVNYYVGAYR